MNRNLPAVVLLFGALAAFCAQAAESSYERFDALVAMSDGVRLDASLYLPKQSSAVPLPLIVRHHGGGSSKESPFDVQYAIKTVETNHFAVLMYSHRGHGISEGFFDFFGPRTTQDFSDMLDWIAANYGDRVDTDNVGSSGYSQGGGESLLPAINDTRVKGACTRFCVNGHSAGNCRTSRSDHDRRTESDQQPVTGWPAGRL
ncbi:MAG: alpha/beta fold hydrolase, partial [Nevskiales bacterium]